MCVFVSKYMHGSVFGGQRIMSGVIPKVLSTFLWTEPLTDLEFIK